MSPSARNVARDSVASGAGSSSVSSPAWNSRNRALPMRKPRTLTSFLPTALLAFLCASASSTAQNSGKSVPPPGIEIPEADRQELEAGAAALQEAEIDAIAHDPHRSGRPAANSSPTSRSSTKPSIGPSATTSSTIKNKSPRPKPSSPKAPAARKPCTPARLPGPPPPAPSSAPTARASTARSSPTAWSSLPRGKAPRTASRAASTSGIMGAAII